MTPTKELLQIEFRYLDKPRSEHFGPNETKTIVLGIYDTLDEAIKAGNEALNVLSKTFQVRADDKFMRNHLFGSPKRLVTNTCYPTNGIQYFASIRQLCFGDLSETIDHTFEAFGRYAEYKKHNQE